MNTGVIRALVALHVRQVAADRSNLFWLFGMPLMFTVLMGMIFGDMGGGAPEAPEVTVYDESRGPASGALVAALGGRESYRIVVADSAGSWELARSLVDAGRRTASLHIPAAFDADLAAGRTAALALAYDPDRASAQAARTALEEAVLRLEYLSAGRRAEAGFDVARFDSIWRDPRITLEVRTLGRLGEEPPPSALSGFTSGYQHTGPSYTLMFVMMFMLMSVRDVVTQRRNGTLRRLRLAAASPWLLATGLFLGPLVVGLVQAAVLLGLNLLLPGMDYGDSPGTLILTMVLFTAVSSALALCVATFCRTPGQADGLGMTASMLLASLGGLWWPLEVVPGFMQKIAMALPTGQAVTIFHNMIGRGWGLAGNAAHLAVLAGMLAVLLVLAATRFRRLVD
ncbi:MAG: ABC transporter permease [Candidatus Latescibacteria bacterium]|nr:ABC transporter permease [Candidatus Latescibacterota bacterium]